MKKILFSLLAFCLSTAAFAQFTTNGANLYFTGGKVGIGTPTPSNILTLRASNALEGIRVESNQGQIAYLGNLGSSSNIHRGLLEIYNNGASSIKLAANTSTDSYINAGNMGIGTTSPFGTLEVVDTGDAQLQITSSSNSGNAELSFLNSYDNYGFKQFLWNGGKQLHFNFGNEFNGGVNATTNIMTLHDNGNIGINTGTTAPLAKLHIEGNLQVKSGEKLQWGGAQTAIEGSTVSNKIALFTNSLERMRVDDGGNVGIGTTSPQAVLDVGSFINGQKLGTVLGRMGEGNSNGDGTFLGVRGYATQSSEYDGKGFALEHNFYGQTNSSINFFRGGGTTGGFVTINTNDNNEKMRITSVGHVGIGTTSPSRELEVHGTGNVYTKVFSANGSNSVLELVETGGVNWSLLNEASTNEFKIRQDGQTKFTISDSGNVGIGTISPSHTLTVQGGPSAAKGINIMDANARIYFDGKRAMEGHATNSRLDIAEGYGTTQIFGNVGMGVINPAEKLEVNGNAIFQGNIESKKVKVSVNPGNWPDYVFASSFELRTLSELETYIKQNQHLPEVPSAKEVEANGLDLGSMDATLLKKVEELTLYTLIQEKKIKQQNEDFNELKLFMLEMKKEIQKLKSKK